MLFTGEYKKIRQSGVLGAGACILCLAWLSVHLPGSRASESIVGSMMDCIPGVEGAGCGFVYRFWSPIYAKYLYAVTEAQKEAILYEEGLLWTYQGVAWRACPPEGDPNLRPVYGFWSAELLTHYYTISPSERDRRLETDRSWTWQYEGIVFYAYPEGLQHAGTRPVHRLWSGSLECYLYTAIETEWNDFVGGDGPLWMDEGIAWYVPPLEPTPRPSITKGPYLLWPAADSMTVVWQTDLPATGRVLYGRRTTDEFLAEETRPVTLHKMTLTGLEPDTTYLYNVSSGGETGPAGTFKTAPATGRSFRFAVYGDTQSCPEVHAAVVQSMLRDRPDVVFHTGDLVAMGGDYDAWGMGFFAPASEILRTTPFVPVPGNHEYWGASPLWFPYFFDSRSAGGWWALTYGEVRFIGLNAIEDYSPGSEQYEWLCAELLSQEAARARWRIVFLHYPPYTCTTGHGDDILVQRILVPLFESCGVNVVFSSHSHAYERYQWQGISYIVTGGGGASLYDLVEDTAPPIRQFGDSVHHYCLVDVDGTRGLLQLQAVDAEGQVFDTVEIGSSPCPDLQP